MLVQLRPHPSVSRSPLPLFLLCFLPYENIKNLILRLARRRRRPSRCRCTRIRPDQTRLFSRPAPSHSWQAWLPLFLRAPEVSLLFPKRKRCLQASCLRHRLSTARGGVYWIYRWRDEVERTCRTPSRGPVDVVPLVCAVFVKL